MPEESKPCSACKEVKPLNEFYKNRSKSDGLHKQCKACMKLSNSEYDKRNPEAVKERKSRFYAKNPDYNRDYYLNNRDEIIVRSRANGLKYREANRESINEKRRIRYAENSEAERARSKAYHAANPDIKRRSVEKRRAQKRGSVVEGYLPTTAELVEFYGKFCLYPECNADRATLDHVVPLSKGGSHTADNFQPLCSHHNSSKGVKVVDYREGIIWSSGGNDADNFI